MLAKELLNVLLPPLKTSDQAGAALAWMDEVRVSHVPLVNNEKYIGLISEADILAMNILDEAFENRKLSFVRPYVFNYQHFYDVLRIAAEQRLTVVPVLDPKECYQGCITIDRILLEMAKITSVSQPGGIIVFEINEHDYALSEISRIVESNDAKVLSSYINTFPESTRIEVTIKVNKIDLSPIIQTFTRYNYQILASFSEESKLDELLSHRYESLMNYLNI
ncbi:MAG TPA: CBS domain-containing protein [Bacteroidales bacterium]|nr:CBS domain-containing protein [Bacteroidales bacterium]